MFSYALEQSFFLWPGEQGALFQILKLCLFGLRHFSCYENKDHIITIIIIIIVNVIVIATVIIIVIITIIIVNIIISGRWK